MSPLELLDKLAEASERGELAEEVVLPVKLPMGSVVRVIVTPPPAERVSIWRWVGDKLTVGVRE